MKILTQRLEEEAKQGRMTNNNNIVDDNDDDDDNEIEEELEGANDSLNLHDAAALERLPQLSSTPDKRRRDVESPVTYSQDFEESSDMRTSTSRGERNQSDMAGNPDLRRGKSDKTKSLSAGVDGQENKVHQRSKKVIDFPEKLAEELVVLSFSSSAGEHDFVEISWGNGRRF